MLGLTAASKLHPKSGLKRGGNISRFDFQDPEVRRLRPRIFVEGVFSSPLSGGNLLQSRPKGCVGFFHVVADFPSLERSN